MLPVERPHWGEGQKGIAWTCIDLFARDCVRVTSLSGSASDCWLRLSRGMSPRESSHNNTVELEKKCNGGSVGHDGPDAPLSHPRSDVMCDVYIVGYMREDMASLDSVRVRRARAVTVWCGSSRASSRAP